MRGIRRLFSLGRLGRDDVERDVDDEIAFHLAMRERRLRERGASPDDAPRLARARFGDVERVRADCLQVAHPHARRERLAMRVDELLHDVRFAARLCARRIGFTTAAVLTLALGIGASTAVFSVVHGVLLQPLPFDDAGRLVTLLHRAPALDLPEMHQGPATYFTYLDHQRSFEAIGAHEEDEVAITGVGDPEQVQALAVSQGTLPLLRVAPLLGRLFRPDDDVPGAPARAILSHGFWQRRFGGAPGAIGQVLSIDGVPTEVVGVLPSSFRFLDADPAVVLPMRLDRAQSKYVMFDFKVVGRLRPGVSEAQATADVARMIALLPPAFAKVQLQPWVRPLADEVIGDIGRVLWVLLAAVGVVLLIACGNVANLFLIRAEGRQQELAVRAALGASRGRIARILLAESTLLALGGGVLGTGVAYAAIGLLRRIAPAELPRVAEIGIDPTVLAFTLCISLLSGAFFGLFAVLRFGTPGVAALREGGRGGGAGKARHRTRNALVVLQVALALTLMVASGLMIRTFVAMRRVEPGFTRPEQVQTFQVAMPAGVVKDDAEVARLHERIARRLAEVPGVRSVGLSSSITMDGEDNTNPIEAEDFPVAPGDVPPLRRFKSVAPGYFETMGNPVLAGRAITWEEVHRKRPVVVVSEVLAREYWGEPARALGKRVRGPGDSWHEIVGVVGAERDDGVNRPPTAIVYWPLLDESYDRRTMAYAVRSDRVGAPGFLRELRDAVWSVHRDLPLAAVQTLDRIQAGSMAQTSFAMVMLGIAAGIALLLGIVGIHGVIAYAAAQRTREIGIRMALGAQAGAVRAMFLRQGLQLTGVGIAIGVVAALVLTRAMARLLFGVAPVDVPSYVAVSALLAAVAGVATWVSARRATRVDPLVALRSEG